MRVILLSDARIKHSKGDIVEVSPEEFNFLVSTRQAKAYTSAVVNTPEDNKVISTTAKKVKRTK